MVYFPRTGTDNRMYSSIASIVLLLHLLQSAISSPVSTLSPSPPPSLPSTFPSLICPVVISPSRLVVRYGDSVSANCSLKGQEYGILGWIPSMEKHPNDPMKEEQFQMVQQLGWHMDSFTEWNLAPACYRISDVSGQCLAAMIITVYKPPNSVSLSYKDHSGPLLEGNMYSLQCDVQNVAPVEKLTVTFYRGDTAISSPEVITDKEKTPLNKTFTHNIPASKEDNGVVFWCEAKLDLGPEGPLPPPLVRSDKISATIYYGPEFLCPERIQLNEGEELNCEVRGNPPPRVTWWRGGQSLEPPLRPNREEAGIYNLTAKGASSTVHHRLVVEVLASTGSSNVTCWKFLMAVLLVQLMCWL